MPGNIGYGKKRASRRLSMGVYTPPTAGQDRIKMAGLLDAGLREKPFQDTTPASMSAEGQMQMNKRTNRQRFGGYR